MKRTIKLSLLLIFIISLSGYSQVVNVDFQRFYDDFEQLKRFNERAEVIYDGSPYLEDEFHTGQIIMDDGIEYKDLQLRYNMFYDQVEFRNEEKVLSIDKGPQFSTFLIGDRVFSYKKFIIKDEIEEGYLEKLADGKYSLFLRHYIVLREGTDAGAYQEARKPTFIPQKPVFMIGSGENVIMPIRKLKDLYKLFPETEEAVNK